MRARDGDSGFYRERDGPWFLGTRHPHSRPARAWTAGIANSAALFLGHRRLATSGSSPNSLRLQGGASDKRPGAILRRTPTPPSDPAGGTSGRWGESVSDLAARKEERGMTQGSPTGPVLFCFDGSEGSRGAGAAADLIERPVDAVVLTVWETVAMRWPCLGPSSPETAPVARTWMRKKSLCEVEWRKRGRKRRRSTDTTPRR